MAYHPEEPRPRETVWRRRGSDGKGRDLGGCVSGQAWRGKGELLSAGALLRETPRGSDGGAE